MSQTHKDLEYLKRKVDEGADGVVTQLFFNNDRYFDFVGRCRKAGIAVPIVPGIMPITNYSQLARFSDNCGAEIPRWIRLKLASFGDDRASIRAFGFDVVTRMCERLQKGLGLASRSHEEHQFETRAVTLEPALVGHAFGHVIGHVFKGFVGLADGAVFKRDRHDSSFVGAWR